MTLTIPQWKFAKKVGATHFSSQAPDQTTVILYRNAGTSWSMWTIDYDGREIKSLYLKPWCLHPIHSKEEFISHLKENLLETLGTSDIDLSSVIEQVEGYLKDDQ